MQHVWLKQYPSSVRPKIDLGQKHDLAKLIEQTCRRYKDNIALTCMGTDLSFNQFDRLATAFGSYLQNDVGLRKGDRLAIMLPNIMQFPIALYAALKIGVVCVNTNPLYTPREMAHQFADSGAKAIVILDMFASKLDGILSSTKIETVIVAKLGEQLPFWKDVIVSGVLKLKAMVPHYKSKTIDFKAAIVAGRKHELNRVEIEGSDLALLQYTGGTTGLSKGAMLTQANILANIHQIQEWAKPYVNNGEERILTALPLYHIFALSVNFLSFLTLGGRMILVPRPVPIKNTVKIFKKYDITVMTAVNSLFNDLNQDKDFRANPPKRLKVALAGGMALHSKVAKDFQSITGTQILEGYGLTEASPVTHCNPIGENRDRSIGVPLPSTDAKIVDESGHELDPGQEGELIIKGPQVMKGYWNRSLESQNVIKDGWLWTGDIARQDDDGFFYIVDRKKDMIIVSGFNVYPNEVEDVLAQHPKVSEAAVVGVSDERQGERVKAFIVRSDNDLSEDDLKRHCANLLTAYKRPVKYEFVENLPKTNVGKILRRALKENVSQNEGSSRVG